LEGVTALLGAGALPHQLVVYAEVALTVTPTTAGISIATSPQRRQVRDTHILRLGSVWTRGQVLRRSLIETEVAVLGDALIAGTDVPDRGKVWRICILRRLHTAPVIAAQAL